MYHLSSDNGNLHLPAATALVAWLCPRVGEKLEQSMDPVSVSLGPKPFMFKSPGPSSSLRLSLRTRAHRLLV